MCVGSTHIRAVLCLAAGETELPLGGAQSQSGLCRGCEGNPRAAGPAGVPVGNVFQLPDIYGAEVSRRRSGVGPLRYGVHHRIFCVAVVHHQMGARQAYGLGPSRKVAVPGKTQARRSPGPPTPTAAAPRRAVLMVT
ncbi:hypothetical protein VTN02DRAFT_6373 [Thermoascus thermophilus]